MIPPAINVDISRKCFNDKKAERFGGLAGISYLCSVVIKMSDYDCT